MPASTTASAVESLTGIADRPHGEQVARGVVGHAPRGEQPLGGPAGRLEPGPLGRAGYRPQRGAPVGLAAPVDRLHERRRHVPADGRLAERARPGHGRRYERGGVADGLALAPRPGQDRDAAAAVGERLDAPGAQPDEELPAVPGGPGAAEVAARRRVAALAGPGRHPPDRVERDARQRHHGRQVLGERLGHGPAVPASRRRVDPLAAQAQHRVELRQRGGGRRRDEQVAAQEPDGVLRGALPVAGIGAAAAALAAAMGPEPREQRGLGHLAAHHPARLGGAVQDDGRRRPADLLEHGAQPGARALGPPREHRGAAAGVGVRQRHHEQLHAPLGAGCLAAEVPEVRLRRAGRPAELEAAVAGGEAGACSALHRATCLETEAQDPS